MADTSWSLWCWPHHQHLVSPRSRQSPSGWRWRRRRSLASGISCYATLTIALLLLASVVAPVEATFIEFDNCLNQAIIDSNPVQLQFLPLNVTAVFDATQPSHNLNITVYGNVTGSATTTPPPPFNDPQWDDREKLLGKIVDLDSGNNKYSTLKARFDVLTFTPYRAQPHRFCSALTQGQCPLGPVFNSSKTDLSKLRAFSVAHDFSSSYAFTTITLTTVVTTGDASNATLACVSANITPALRQSIKNLLRFMPLAVLILVGIATISAAVYSPWGSSDTFKWTSNYGRDADLLRLVTPGFGDCLQYIQFVVLTGGLSLGYPGYYRPVVSQASWSVLMFNTSYVSHGNGTQGLVDGIYVTNGTYGLDRLSQLVGMSTAKDIWAGMVIWLLVVIGAVVILIQAGFAFRWTYRHLSKVQEEDLRAKNLPFTAGNVIRIVFNYFLLPAVALSMFQLVIAGRAPIAAYTTVLAVVLLIALVGFGAFLLRLIATVRPRLYLFDDLPTVLLYGPLYNTYSDDAAGFTMIPLFVQFLRGIAIGALQPSGIAQLVLLAICEIILILTLHAFRPFHTETSMNAYHTFFAIVRLITTLLSVAFVPSLGVTEAPKGWIGYVILLMHAIVLVFGFFLNAIQTLIEVGARLAGAGGHDSAGGGAARGGLVKVFGMRQLSRRMSRRPGGPRASGLTEPGVLTPDGDHKSPFNGGRPRSTSGSSAVLLNRYTTSDGRASTGLESNSAYGVPRPDSGSMHTPTTPGAQSTFSGMPRTISAQEGIIGLQAASSADPYYRPPRRKPTAEAQSPADRGRGSWGSADWANKSYTPASPTDTLAMDPHEGPSVSGRATPVPAYLAARDGNDANPAEPRGSNTDYAVREVDFYYGVRGPALSNLPMRRLKTGPADPEGPVSSATGWFKGLFGGKTKDKGKGFEVVRSARAPPPAQSHPLQEPSGPNIEGDSRELGEMNNNAAFEEANHRGNAGVAIGRPLEDDEVSAEEESYGSDDDLDSQNQHRLSDFPPTLPGIDTGGAIQLPSRVGSRTSTRPSAHSSLRRSPTVPRKSSKRKSIPPVGTSGDTGRLSAIRASPPASPGLERRDLYDPHRPQQYLRTEDATRLPFGSEVSSAHASTKSTGGDSAESALIPGIGGDAQGRDGGPGPGPHQQHARLASSSSALGSLAPDVANDRPTSIGRVQQHRTGDYIHNIVQGSPEGVDYLESSAELVDGPSGRRGSAISRRSVGE